MELISSALQVANKTNILVYGDIILDKFVHFDLSGVTPDSPVPVYFPFKKEFELGGASNVSKNLSDWNVNIFHVGIYGKPIIKQIFESHGINTSYLIHSSEHKQVKKRFMIDGKKHFRSDCCTKVEGQPDLLLKLKERIRDCLKNENIDTVVVADYGDGMCNPVLLPEIIELVKRYDVPVFLDPDGAYFENDNFEKYKGVSVMKLSDDQLKVRYKCKQFTNDDQKMKECSKYSKMIMDEVGCYAVFVTLGNGGIFYRVGDERCGIVECKEQRVGGNTSGCGDNVMAIISRFHQRNMTELSMVSMLNLANDFASINVTRPAASHVKLVDWVKEQKETLQCSMQDSIHLIKYLRSKSIKVGCTSGCFDLFHVGHSRFLKFCRSQCDVFVVFLNSDESVRKLKGLRRPIVPLEQRMEMLVESKRVDILVVFEEVDFMPLLHEIQPDIFIKGGDCNREQLQRHCPEGLNVKIGPVPHLVISTTKLEQSIVDRKNTILDR